jgi:hypothetical protein
MTTDTIKTDNTFVVMPITSGALDLIREDSNHYFASGEGNCGDCCIFCIPCTGTFDCILLPFRAIIRLFKKKKVDQKKLNEQTRNGLFVSKRWVMV